MRIIVLRVDGTTETHSGTFDDIARLIGATNIETVNIGKDPGVRASFPTMRHPVMMIDEDGYEVEVVDHGPGPVVLGVNPGERPDGAPVMNAAFRLERRPVRARKPFNPNATLLYHAICIPGTTHQIVGDAAIIDDSDV